MEDREKLKKDMLDFMEKYSLDEFIKVMYESLETYNQKRLNNKEEE